VKNVNNYPVRKSAFRDWESVFRDPSPIRTESLKTGTIASKISGIINLKNEKASELADGTAKVPVLAHLIRHEKYGDYLVDTGFDSSFSKETGGNFKGLCKRFYFKKRYMQDNESEGIENQLKEKSVNLKGVFLTHMHEHASGAISLPNDIPYVYGDGESEINVFPLVYSDFLGNKNNQILNFSLGQDMPILGKCIDLFGDGSFWAISTPGHTKGHVSYIVNGKEAPLFLTGDACISKKGYELGVETGSFSSNIEEGRTSFLKIMELLKKYPELRVVFGHETDQYKIEYEL
jgi:glyoxylase-like metal-dependent hydrolase (beta-lactamase superfamily II)